MANSSPDRYLEDFPANEIPQELRPLSKVASEALETFLVSTRTVTEYQKAYAWQYTLCCLEKNAILRHPVAALAYAHQLANRSRTEYQNTCLKRLAGIVKSFPPDRFAAFKGLVEKFTAPPPPLVLPGGMGMDGEGGPNSEGDRQSTQQVIQAMQQCLKGTSLQAVVNFDEAVAQARTALDQFPEHPDVLIQAAVCYKTRAAREKDLPIELRVQDMQRAAELMERYIRLSLKPENRNRPDFQARRAVVNNQLNAMRKSLQDVQEKMKGKKKKEE
jgi:hypothetical protein